MCYCFPVVSGSDFPASRLCRVSLMVNLAAENDERGFGVRGQRIADRPRTEVTIKVKHWRRRLCGIGVVCVILQCALLCHTLMHVLCHLLVCVVSDSSLWCVIRYYVLCHASVCGCCHTPVYMCVYNAGLRKLQIFFFRMSLGNVHTHQNIFEEKCESTLPP